jgi:nudix-type nucleoside diphosphatase (YffH/AdpP family)
VNHSLFLYGTLCDPELFRIVGGADLSGTPALLEGHASVWAEGESFPLIVERSGARAEGLLIEIGAETKARLDFYELGFHYTLREVGIDTASGPVRALVYFPDPGIWTEGQAWSLPRWQATWGPLSREAAGEYMCLMGHLDPAAAAAAFPQIRMRASSRLRARAHPSPVAFAPAMSAADVRVIETRRPYTHYFSVREDDLQFPTFAGRHSATVNRAAFMGGDAVTVLPYDPERDTVLVIRQFRQGAFVRGDANPWTLEPAAGRIDPGETPEETARREMREETGLEAITLHRVAEYYPSPGAYSEFLISYVATADLAGRDGETGGLQAEHEDIMSHVIGFDHLLEMIETGAANTGPLVTSALWLARHRRSLRRVD